MKDQDFTTQIVDHFLMIFHHVLQFIFYSLILKTELKFYLLNFFQRIRLSLLSLNRSDTTL